ncbi:hypothetical protein CABS01_10158, partial [Colletotrichum abscissum]|uniref:uncharacterized protein n=1 Tax=Colletotrichum abscissum TaxID=1671311 RepID=UPI0027D49C12
FSPLHCLTYQNDEWALDAVAALSRANLEGQPATLKQTSDRLFVPDFAFEASRGLLFFGMVPEVATAFACGPLSMAIINNDSDEVDRILRRFPDSIAELDLYKRSPLHLASTKPEILGRLLEVADFSILKQRDRTGANALDMAMALSSRHCVNGREHVRCRECSCYLCAKYLLNATYNLTEDGEKRTTSDKQGSILRSQEQLQICDEAGGAIDSMSDWVFRQIRSVNLARLFYRHGFMPRPSIFPQLCRQNLIGFGLWEPLNPVIVCWLQEHGGDVFWRSPMGLINKTADDRVFLTFEALDLVHSCCSTFSQAKLGTAWTEMDNAEIIEDQGFLLDLHEKLVAEFSREAGRYLGNGPNNEGSFPQFLRSYWTDRITEELEKLNGEDLTHEERRGAEEIGVVWHGPTKSKESKKRNPYPNRYLEHCFSQLDRICPEYNEPWPEGIRRKH